MNKKLLDLSPICVIEENDDPYQCPYNHFKRTVNLKWILPLASDDYCKPPEVPQLTNYGSLIEDFRREL